MTVTYVDRAGGGLEDISRPKQPTFDAFFTEVPIRELSATREFSARWIDDSHEGHRLFGSETVEALWQERTKIWLFGKREWRSSRAIRIAEVARDEDRERYRVRLQIAENERIGYWLQMTDEQGTVHACILPRDMPADAREPVYEISLDRSPWQGGRMITRLQANLGDQGGPLSYAATVWRRYVTEHVAAACGRQKQRSSET